MGRDSKPVMMLPPREMRVLVLPALLLLLALARDRLGHPPRRCQRPH